MISGSLVAIITPFKKNKIDYEALTNLIEFQIAGGTHGIVPCGTTGESPTLSHDEHMDVIKHTIEVVDKRVPVIAGTGSNSTEEAINLTKFAQQAGADGFLFWNPAMRNRVVIRGMLMFGHGKLNDFGADPDAQHEKHVPGRFCKRRGAVFATRKTQTQLKERKSNPAATPKEAPQNKSGE